MEQHNNEQRSAAQLLRERILGLRDCPPEPVEVPEWNVTVYMRHLNGVERDQFRALLAENASVGVSFSEAALLALTVVDEAGERVFAEADIEALRVRNAAVLDRLSNRAMEINGIGKKAEDNAEKN